MIELTNKDLLKTKAYINGQWVSGEDVFDVMNPANNEIIAQLPKLGVYETRCAIDAAYEAQKKWQNITAKERAFYLKNWLALIKEFQEDLAQILTAEQGKILAESRAEIAYGASYVEWFAEEAKRIYGDVLSPPSSDKRLIVTKEPIGVVACITPWNFPNAMLARKIAPALAAGCSVVCKPAEQTPLSALALAELSQKAKIPPGVINIITGDAETIGAELTSHSQIRKLTFTGSTQVGKLLQAQCASTLKRTSMELGGNAPFIVFNDADINDAVEGLMASKFRNSGQTCVCTNRVFVQEDIMQSFTKKLTKRVKSLNIGCGTEKETDLGPLISKEAVMNINEMVKNAVRQGASIILGGRVCEEKGYFYEPTILTNIHHDMEITQQEIFGPVLTLISFQTDEEVLRMANDTPMGLAAYFYSQNINRVWKVSEALEYGIIGVNESIISNEAAPFGGIKESGQGREGSKYGLDDYLEIKYICLGGIS